MSRTTRREFIRNFGLGTASLPFILNLPSLAFANQAARKQRLVVMFSPNGIVPKAFWPEKEGKDFELKEILKPLAPYQDRLLTLHGVCDKIRGDGDGHMRGIGCLLTGKELFPGNVQGGSDTPAGWCSGISIDQEIKNVLQANEATKTRFGSLEFGVMVPEHADTWTRMIYAGPNKPVAPLDSPHQMFNKLYAQTKDRELLASVLDGVQEDLKRVSRAVSAEDRRLLDEHATFVREMEQELKAAQKNDAEKANDEKATNKANAETSMGHLVPEMDQGIKRDNDNMPKLSKAQIDLMVNSFANDFARVASLQYTSSVGQARMRWLGIDEQHHELSHEPDSNEKAVEKLTKINVWFCEQLAYLTKRLAETPEPGGEGTLLDNTLIVWTNELGKGNSHTQDDIPFVLVGNGANFQMGRSLKFPKIAHNRLLLSLAHGFGHNIKSFGNPDYCGDGALGLG